MIQLVYNTSGGKQAVTIGVTCFFNLLNFLIGCPGCLASASRVIWTFAREGGLPEVFARIDQRQKLPINALLLSWACVCCLALIYIGNETAFYGLCSGVTVVMIFSYAMPIFLRLVYGFKNVVVPPGPFSLGRWGVPINIFAVCWSTYLLIFLCFPTEMPVTKENMNYASLIFGACLLTTQLAWEVYGRRTYLGPLAQVDMPLEGIRADNVTSQSQEKKTGDVSNVHAKSN